MEMIPQKYLQYPIIMQALKDYGYVEKISHGIIRCNRKLQDFARRELDIMELESGIRVVIIMNGLKR